MIRTRSLAAAVSLAAICALPALAAPADAAKKKKVTCTKRSGDTLYRDASLRLFQVVKGVKATPTPRR